MKLRIRKGDMVTATTGKDRVAKKTGKVLRVFPRQGKVIVEGINLVSKHVRPSQKNPQGGIVQRETAIRVSNVQIYCTRCRKGVRVGVRRAKDGSSTRYCRKCGEPIGK